MKRINLMSTKSFNHKGATGDFGIALTNGIDLVPAAIYKYEHEDLLATAQRPADHFDDIFDSFKELRKLFIWTIIVGVHGDCRVLDAKGDLIAIDVPENEEEAAKYAKDIEFVDGQNRTLSLKEIATLVESYPVILCVLDDPAEEEVMDRFSEINGTAKPMSKDLLFEFDYKRNRLAPNQRRMYELLMRMNEDPKHPLFNRIKFGNGTGYSAKTIVEFVCSGPRDLITALEDAGKRSQDEQYQVLLRYWQAIALENSSDSTLGSPEKHKGERQRMSAQKVAYATSICETAVQLLTEDKNNKKNLTIGNLQSVYHMWVNDILHVNKLIESDNGTTEYYNVEGELVDIVTDRWNGRARARKAIQADHDLLYMAYAKQLRV